DSGIPTSRQVRSAGRRRSSVSRQLEGAGMLTRGRWGAGGLRGALVAFALMALAVAGSWLIPGLAWHGLAAMQRPAAQESVPPSVRTAPAPTVPGMHVPAPEPASATAGPASLWTRASGLIGLVLILAIGVALSHNRRAIRWRVIAWGLGLQLLFAIFVLRIPAGQALFRWLGALITGILSYSYVGSQFVFGELGKPNSSLGIIFAFQLLPAIIFVSALF